MFSLDTSQLDLAVCVIRATWKVFFIGLTSGDLQQRFTHQVGEICSFLVSSEFVLKGRFYNIVPNEAIERNSCLDDLDGFFYPGRQSFHQCNST